MNSSRLERLISGRIEANVAVGRALLHDRTFLATVAKAGRMLAKALQSGNKVLFFGNGSAADAQHLAAELTGRFMKERPALAGLALTTNPSSITALGNDYGYETIFARASWPRRWIIASASPRTRPRASRRPISSPATCCARSSSKNFSANSDSQSRSERRAIRSNAEIHSPYFTPMTVITSCRFLRIWKSPAEYLDKPLYAR